MPKNAYCGYTDVLNRHPAENICHAFDFAKFIGRPLNNYVVINFDDTAALYGGTTFRKVVHKFRDWFNRRTKQLYGNCLPPAFIYSLENPNGQVHANWVVNVPPELQAEFEKKHRRWVRKAQGDIRRYDVAIFKVDPHTDKSLAKYVIKGIDGNFISYLHMQEYASPQGRIWGRRAGVSPSISRTARNKAGFVAKQHRHQWKRRAANDDGVAAAA